jgi:hypothetical protein
MKRSIVCCSFLLHPCYQEWRVIWSSEHITRTSMDRLSLYVVIGYRRNRQAFVYPDNIRFTTIDYGLLLGSSLRTVQQASWSIHRKSASWIKARNVVTLRSEEMCTACIDGMNCRTGDAIWAYQRHRLRTVMYTIKQLAPPVGTIFCKFCRQVIVPNTMHCRLTHWIIKTGMASRLKYKYQSSVTWSHNKQS